MAGTFIKRDTVAKMVVRFMKDTQKKDKGTGKFRNMDKSQDAYGIAFDVDLVLQLLRENGVNLQGSNPGLELRVYLGMRGKAQEEQGELNNPGAREGQHNAILVVVKDEADQLARKGESQQDAVNRSTSSTKGDSTMMALDEGRVCPPPACNTDMDGEIPA